MYLPKVSVKKDPVKRWNQPDRRFFACGACHILAHAFLEAFPDAGFTPVWIRPKESFTGNHIFVTDGRRVFDYHGYSQRKKFIAHYFAKSRRDFPGWDADLVPVEVSLISGEANHHHAGLYILKPEDFLHNALPRARQFLKQFNHGQVGVLPNLALQRCQTPLSLVVRRTDACPTDDSELI